MVGELGVHAGGDGKHGRVFEADLQRARRSRKSANRSGEFAAGERLARAQDRPGRRALAGAFVAAWNDSSQLHSSANDPRVAGSDAPTAPIGAGPGARAHSGTEGPA